MISALLIQSACPAPLEEMANDKQMQVFTLLLEPQLLAWQSCSPVIHLHIHANAFEFYCEARDKSLGSSCVEREILTN